MAINDTIISILNRRSYREYTDKAISEQDLNLILQAGTYAPSAKNQQSAQLLVLKNDIKREALRTLAVKKFGHDPFYGAKEFVLVAANKNTMCPIQDGSCCMENMMVAAESLGIASCWINCVEELFNTEEGKELKKSFGIEEEMMIVGTLILGYAKNYPEYPKPRKAQYVRFIK